MNTFCNRLFLVILLSICGCSKESTVSGDATERSDPQIFSLGTCYTEGDEYDDTVVGTDTSECDATWENSTIGGDAVSLDTRTGLMWSRESAAGDFNSELDASDDGMVNWFEAVGEEKNLSATCTDSDHNGCNPDGEGFCKILNSLSYAGFDDWRPAGQKEFMQAYVDGAVNNASVFDKTHYYWAHTTESDSAIWGSYIFFGGGLSNSDARKNSSGWAHAICVRNNGNAQIPAINGCIANNDEDDYVTAGADECDATWENETIGSDLVSKDARTSLMWSRSSVAGDFASETDGVDDGIVNWFEAMGVLMNTSGTCSAADFGGCNTDGEGYCDILNSGSYAGFTDWRPPGNKELIQAYIDGGSHQSVFGDNLAKRYWSRAIISDNTVQAAVQRMGYGNGQTFDRNVATTQRAICVRTYQ